MPRTLFGNTLKIPLTNSFSQAMATIENNLLSLASSKAISPPLVRCNLIPVFLESSIRDFIWHLPHKRQLFMSSTIFWLQGVIFKQCGPNIIISLLLTLRPMRVTKKLFKFMMNLLIRLIFLQDLYNVPTETLLQVVFLNLPLAVHKLLLGLFLSAPIYYPFLSLK